MASIAKDPGGKKRILFSVGESRRAVRLGKASLKTAEYVRLRIESIIAARLSGSPIDAETSRWLGDIGDDLHARLARVGLVEPRQKAEALTLGDLLDAYFGAVSIKPSTMRTYRQTERALLDYFGRDRLAESISADEAEQ